MLAGLAWRNLWRQPRRTLLSVSSIAFAALVMIFLLSFQLGVYGTMKENVLRIIDGFAQVQPDGYKQNPTLRKTIASSSRLIDRLRKVPGVDAAAPRAMTFALLSKGNKSFAAEVVGVDPEAEVRVSRLSHTVSQGRYLRPGDGADIVIGVRLARTMGVHVGDTITLLGQALDGSIAADVLKVAGIFDTGTDEVDRQLAEMPLSRFQSTFLMNGAVNSIVLSGPSLGSVDRALGQVRKLVSGKGLSVRNWEDLQPGLAGAISLDFHTSLLWYASLVIVVVFIILNTLLMSVLERTREFAVLLAVGMQPVKIGVMIWLELMFLALVGVAAGIVIGDVVTAIVAHYGLALPGSDALFAKWGVPGRMSPRLSLASMTAGPAVMTFFILVSGIFPYGHVRGLEPVTAMRSSL